MKNKINKKNKKIALGMSGGVDSSVCAHLLVEQGYDVTGVFLECWRAPRCRSEQDRKDALQVALDLGIPFKVLDFKKTYKEKVVENFFAEYEAGRTPNPDVLCNKEIKFGLFYDWAIQEGFDAIATGHYAKISEIDNTAQLCIPKDEHKDQTYFLYLTSSQQLEHTVFPLQNMTKQEVRKEAEKRKLAVADKKDSVGICFIGDINVHNFLEERLGENPGEVIDTAGNVIGSHNGLWFYTIGQRSGFKINAKTIIKQDDGSTISKHNIPPFYVIRKNPYTNQLVVGFGAETLQSEFKIENEHWIQSENQNTALESDEVYVRIRHTGSLEKCSVTESNGKIVIQLKKAIKGIAEGQSAVLYWKQNREIICLGGGVICI